MIHKMISVRLPDDMLRELEQLARQEDRPVAYLVRKAIAMLLGKKVTK